jgi:prepilin-type N-terminal cleavage/methylation domain-containing protein
MRGNRLASFYWVDQGLAPALRFWAAHKATSWSVNVDRQRTEQRGFSLVEMMMALAILGLVVAFALPKLNYGAYRVNGAVRGAAGLLARAQRMAVTEQNNVNVLFDVTHQAIKLHEDANDNNQIDAGERVRSYPLGELVVFGTGGAPTRQYTPSPISFTRTQGGSLEIIFRRDGSASENGGFYLTQQNSTSAADARAIEVIQATGRAEWYQYNGSAWVKKF